MNTLILMYNKRLTGGFMSENEYSKDKHVTFANILEKINIYQILITAACSILSIVITAACMTEWVFPEQLNNIRDSIANVESAIGNLNDALNTTVTGFNTRIEGSELALQGQYDGLDKAVEAKLDAIGTNIDALTKRVDELGTQVASLLQSGVTNKYFFTATACDNIFISSLEMNLGAKDAPYTGETISFFLNNVAVDDAGKIYTGADLAETPILLSYKEGDKETFFCGQLNDDGYWDGNCIVNVYENGLLTLITDAIYDGGNLVNYKQAYTFTSFSGETVWAISKKTEENHGEIWTYFYQDFIQAFSYEDLDASKVFTVDGFEALIQSVGFVPEGYFYGSTSEGYYNDTSGKSYMVKYFRNGDVRTLYLGHFVNGTFNDDTGNAWMIGKASESQATYTYYKGIFESGKGVEDASHWKNNLTQEQIASYLEKYSFNVPLTGLKDSPKYLS